MNPEDELSQRWIELGRMASNIVDFLAALPLTRDLEETMRVAALKRGSRRPHGGQSDFL